MVTQLFIYGISLPFTWKKKWEDENNSDFQSAFLEFRDSFWEVGSKQSKGILYPYTGRDGDSIIIGIVLERKNQDTHLYNPKLPVTIPELTDKKKKIFEDALKYYFGIKEGFHYFMVFRVD